ncbi:MAG: S1-like domain-containing RNA-binding protein [Lachnospiraceae bacterium]|nr:S1-like domain-containing RNA-binding protein [Agathobacter sp.]MDD6290520.1 S1-like domain-containing RNA-binding protein [Lachnospiraceae bacterium]
MKLGEYQELYYRKKVNFGMYLAESMTGEDYVLLPARQVPADAAIGEKIRVFIYKDSKDRLIATINQPKLTLGQYAPLLVREIGKIGAFLDWGLEKDLFLPYREMIGHVEEGDEILVTLYIDKSNRLCASMRGLYELLSKDSPYKQGELVSGRVYEFSDNFGAFVAVDDQYSARIPNSEDHSFLRIGDVIEAKITSVKPDGKLDLTLREKAYVQMDSDAKKLLQILDSYAGILPFTEKASPEVIRRETGLSKAAFKRAIGRLYKERKITLNDGKIRKNTV